MFLSLQSIFFIIPKYVFYASYSMFFLSRGACFLLICCMLFFSTFLLIPCMLFTSVLHVLLVVSTHYFSRIYQSSLFFFHGFPSHPCFHNLHVSSQRENCLHVRPSFALPLNPSLKRIYPAALSTCFFPSVLLVVCYYIYSVRGLDWGT